MHFHEGNDGENMGPEVGFDAERGYRWGDTPQTVRGALGERGHAAFRGEVSVASAKG